MRSRHEDERPVASEPERARRMISESRDLVARTRDAVAQSRKLLDRVPRNPAKPGAAATPVDVGPSAGAGKP